MYLNFGVKFFKFVEFKIVIWGDIDFINWLLEVLVSKFIYIYFFILVLGYIYFIYLGYYVVVINLEYLLGSGIWYYFIFIG